MATAQDQTWNPRCLRIGARSATVCAGVFAASLALAGTPVRAHARVGYSDAVMPARPLVAPAQRIVSVGEDQTGLGWGKGDPLNLNGSARSSLEFFPNEYGVEVDRPTAIAYSPDGQSVLVAAMGTRPGGANLSVYDATTLEFVREVPLTHVPEEMAVVPGTSTVLLSSPGTTVKPNDKLTVVDYVAGTEDHIIDVVLQPRGIAISPDSSQALVVGVDAMNSPAWGLVDLTTHTMTDSLAPPPGAAPMTLWLGGTWGGYNLERSTPIYLPSGTHVAVLAANFINVDVQVVDLETHAVVESHFVASPAPYHGGIRGSADGSTVAVVAREGFPTPTNIRLFALDTENGATQSVIVGTAPFEPTVSPPLVRTDGSAVAAVSGDGVSIVSMTTGEVASADVSGFDFSHLWWPVCNLGGGQYFLLWRRGAGAEGYQIFDWDTGAHVAELVIDDLRLNSHVLTEGAVVSPINDMQVVMFDSVNQHEDLILLDLDPTDPQVLVRSHCGDAVEGDRAIDLKLSADHSIALQTNYQSANTCFIDMQTMAVDDWIDIFDGVTDAALTADGNTAAFIAGQSAQGVLLVDRLTAATTHIALPPDAIAVALALDSSDEYLYVLLGYQGMPTSELVRIELASKALDPNIISLPHFPPAAPVLAGITLPFAPLHVVLNEPERWAAQSHDGSLMAVATTGYVPGQNKITLIDRGSWSTTAELDVAGIPAIMEFSADDERLYIGTNSSLDVIAVEREKSSVIASIPQVSEVRSMALSPDQAKLYLAVAAVFTGTPEHMRVIDAAALQESGDLQLPLLNDFGSGLPQPDLHNVTHLRWIKDGAELVAFCWNGDVHRIDTATDELIESFSSGFLAPSDVIQLRGSDDASLEHFILCSAQDSNDGLANLSIEIEVPCAADISEGDGMVDVWDLLMLLSNWGTDGPGADLAGPHNEVDVFDLLALLVAWGEC